MHGLLGSQAGTRSERARPPQEAEMADVAAPSWRVKPRPLALVAGVAGVLFATTFALWAHYGTAVFFEMIRAGFAACF
jgi:hypothetical protein